MEHLWNDSALPFLRWLVAFLDAPRCYFGCEQAIFCAACYISRILSAIWHWPFTLLPNYPTIAVAIHMVFWLSLLMYISTRRGTS